MLSHNALESLSSFIPSLFPLTCMHWWLFAILKERSLKQILLLSITHGYYYETIRVESYITRFHCVATGIKLLHINTGTHFWATLLNIRWIRKEKKRERTPLKCIRSTSLEMAQWYSRCSATSQLQGPRSHRIFSALPGFNPPPKIMPVGELAKINCTP